MLLRGRGLVPWRKKGGGENRSMIMAIMCHENTEYVLQESFLISYVISSLSHIMSLILIVLSSFIIEWFVVSHQRSSDLFHLCQIAAIFLLVSAVKCFSVLKK